MNNISKIHNQIIRSDITIISALKYMDEVKSKRLFVFDGDRFDCMLTIGDIQRAIIHNVPLVASVSEILDRGKIYASTKDTLEQIKQVMLSENIDCMPILNENRDIVDVLFWHDVFTENLSNNRSKIDLPVVIMAGGKGTRLKPLTNVIPKPLIPVGDKTIIEEIMDQFEGIGCTKFYMSVNYKVDMMKFYLSQLEHQYDIEYFQEGRPLGTIGSVALLKGKIHTPFIVSNCDIVIDQDYRDVYDYHKENGNDITLVTAVKTQRIPYGVIETGENGLMVGLKEKPDNTFMFNTGVYILNSELIDEIPEGELFHITDLMEKVKARGGRVGCFPVSDKAWHDMGEWSEYLKMIKVL